MIAIVDYGAGNLTSVKLALDKLGARSCITSEPRDVATAERVVFPGVGAIGSAMESLREMGLIPALREFAASGKPFLGICLGTQIVLERSDEDGGVDGIGFLRGAVRLFRPSDPLSKVPQMGWNGVDTLVEHPVFEEIESGSEFYFVHSYYPAPSDDECILAETDYADVTFASIVGKDNLVATQFHPERSGRVGLKLLQNFIGWNP